MLSSASGADVVPLGSGLFLVEPSVAVGESANLGFFAVDSLRQSAAATASLIVDPANFVHLEFASTDPILSGGVSETLIVEGILADGLASDSAERRLCSPAVTRTS